MRDHGCTGGSSQRHWFCGAADGGIPVRGMRVSDTLDFYGIPAEPKPVDVICVLSGVLGADRNSTRRMFFDSDEEAYKKAACSGFVHEIRVRKKQGRKRKIKRVWTK